MGDEGNEIGGLKGKAQKAWGVVQANPYLAAAAVVVGGFSYFSARRAEKRRRRRLKNQMNQDIAGVQETIPGIQQEYGRTADMYRASGNVQGQMIYARAASQMQMGGQSNLKHGSEDVRRSQIGGLLGQQLQNQNIQTQNRVYQTQNQLSSELNRQQMNIDEIRASYSKQGISSEEVSIGDVNTMKYV